MQAFHTHTMYLYVCVLTDAYFGLHEVEQSNILLVSVAVIL